MNILLAYDRALSRSPILVKTLTSAALFGLGDVMAQTIAGSGEAAPKSEGRQGLDLQRVGRMVIWGGMFAPLAHAWYGRLDKMIPGSGAIVVAQKVAADQVCCLQVMQ
jgi:protein Mpv17